MDKWIEYDPHTGVRETNYATDEDDKVVVVKEQDVQPLLDRNAELRNTKATDIGIRKGLWHYARIPVTVQYELLKKGINIFRPEDDAKLFAELEANYPNLKTTNKKHLIRTPVGRTSLAEPKTSPSKESSTKHGPLLIVR